MAVGEQAAAESARIRIGELLPNRQAGTFFDLAEYAASPE